MQKSRTIPTYSFLRKEINSINTTSDSTASESFVCSVSAEEMKKRWGCSPFSSARRVIERLYVPLLYSFIKVNGLVGSVRENVSPFNDRRCSKAVFSNYLHFYFKEYFKLLMDRILYVFNQGNESCVFGRNLGTTNRNTL